MHEAGKVWGGKPPSRERLLFEGKILPGAAPGRLPPVEDLLRELCGAAVALYSLPEGAAVESYSPTGQLPLWLGVAVMAARTISYCTGTGL